MPSTLNSQRGREVKVFLESDLVDTLNVHCMKRRINRSSVIGRAIAEKLGMDPSRVELDLKYVPPKGRRVVAPPPRL